MQRAAGGHLAASQLLYLSEVIDKAEAQDS